MERPKRDLESRIDALKREIERLRKEEGGAGGGLVESVNHLSLSLSEFQFRAGFRAPGSSQIPAFLTSFPNSEDILRTYGASSPFHTDELGWSLSPNPLLLAYSSTQSDQGFDLSPRVLALRIYGERIEFLSVALGWWIDHNSAGKRFTLASEILKP